MESRPTWEAGVHAMREIFFAAAEEVALPDAEDRKNPYFKYVNDPVGFLRDKFRVTLTPDVTELVESVWKYGVVQAKSGNAVGKTHGIAHVICAFFLIFPDSQCWITAAPPFDPNLKQLLWGEIMRIVRKNYYLFRYCIVREGSFEIKRKDNPLSFIQGLAIPQSASPSSQIARFSGKHAPHMLFAVDEADAVPAEIFTAIDGCMSGGFARLVLMFNPREESGPVHQMERRGISHVVNLNVFRHPNVITGRDVIPGAVTREKTLQRIYSWTRQLMEGEDIDSECFEVPDYLVGCSGTDLEKNAYPPLEAGFRKVMEPTFYYMVLGEYPTISEVQLINRAWVDAAVMRRKAWLAGRGMLPPAGVRPTCGQDVAEYGKDLSVWTPRWQIFVGDQVIWQGVDPVETGRKAAQLCLNVDALELNVDANGVGSGTPRAARDAGFSGAKRIMVTESAPLDEDSTETQCALVRDYLLWKLREWLRTDRGAMLPDCPLLREELLAPSYHKDNKDRIKVTDSATLREKLRRSPDRLFSLALTFASEIQDRAEIHVRSYIGNGNGHRNGLGMEGARPRPMARR